MDGQEAGLGEHESLTATTIKECHALVITELGVGKGSPSLRLAWQSLVIICDWD